jgi:hypothetical protein
MRRAASLSFSLLEPHRESISSMKMMEGLFSLARLNRFFTNLKIERVVESEYETKGQCGRRIQRRRREMGMNEKYPFK